MHRGERHVNFAQFTIRGRVIADAGIICKTSGLPTRPLHELRRARGILQVGTGDDKHGRGGEHRDAQTVADMGGKRHAGSLIM